MSTSFKVWPCKKRRPKMRPVISTTHHDYTFSKERHSSVGIWDADAADAFDMRVDLAKRAASRGNP